MDDKIKSYLDKIKKEKNKKRKKYKSSALLLVLAIVAVTSVTMINGKAEEETIDLTEAEKGNIQISISNDIPSDTTIESQVVLFSQNKESKNLYKQPLVYSVKDKNGNVKHSDTVNFDENKSGYIIRNLQSGDKVSIIDIPTKYELNEELRELNVSVTSHSNNELHKVIPSDVNTQKIVGESTINIDVNIENQEEDNEEDKEENQEDKQEEEDKEIKNGNIQINLSKDILEEALIKVNLNILAQKDNKEITYDEPIKYEIVDKNKKVSKSGKLEFTKSGYIFENLKSGDVLNIFDIPSKIKIDDSLIQTKANIVATSENTRYPVVANKPGKIEILEEDTVKVELSLDVPQTQKLETKDTFKSTGGEYTFEYILGNYNIFSFEDVEGTHILGPVVAARDAYRSKNQGDDPLVFGDRANGYPSYVGNLTESINKNDTSFRINYFYDINHSGGEENFKIPKLYTKLSGNEVNKNGDKYEVKIGEKVYSSPNSHGDGETLQNDSFISVSQARAELLQQSKDLAKSKDNIVVKPDNETGYLKIEVGKNYLIEDASRLRVIDFIYPKGYDPITKPYPEETIINITGNTLPESIATFKGFDPGGGWISDRKMPTINKEVHQFFPMTIVDGKQFNGGLGLGEGFEYGEMNNIIFNMPNIKTKDGGRRVVLKEAYSDVLGHIVAPKAEFWNYEPSGDGYMWSGGNMNGTAIVDSWHGGKLESHMWPYKKTKIQQENVEFIKTDLETGDRLSGAEFEMIKVMSETDHTIDTSVEHTHKATSGTNGIINFNGIHTNTVYKMIETKPPKGYEPIDGYWIVKLEGSNLDGGQIKVNIKKYGNAPEIGTDHVITNKKEKLSFNIIKTDEETGELLPGAVFDLYRADDKGKPVGDPIIKDITTDKNGEVQVESTKLNYDTLYVLVETKAPEGYVSGKKIVFYIKGTDGLFGNISNKVVIGNNGNVEITNVKDPYGLPDTGGNGIYNYILVGMFIMMASFFVHRKVIN